ncbi:hypothetical protein ABZ618_30025 [Streptomyces roseolus]|uniref:hypothetical protein n=1 Tax=Streptomyces roseolus TaxID=67358 RepID=UPI0033E767FC
MTVTSEHLEERMHDRGAPGSAEGFGVFAVDADWPESRQVTGHGHTPASGDAHVYLWFGSPHVDPEAAHVTVLSATSGNAEAGEALERAFETFHHPDEETPAGLPVFAPVAITTDGEPVTFELWRSGGNPRWVARGHVGRTDVILTGGGVEPGELSLIRVTDLTSFTNPFASPWMPEPFLG